MFLHLILNTSILIVIIVVIIIVILQMTLPYLFLCEAFLQVNNYGVKSSSVAILDEHLHWKTYHTEEDCHNKNGNNNNIILRMTATITTTTAMIET